MVILGAVEALGPQGRREAVVLSAQGARPVHWGALTTTAKQSENFVRTSSTAADMNKASLFAAASDSIRQFVSRAAAMTPSVCPDAAWIGGRGDSVARSRAATTRLGPMRATSALRLVVDCHRAAPGSDASVKTHAGSQAATRRRGFVVGRSGTASAPRIAHTEAGLFGAFEVQP